MVGWTLIQKSEYPRTRASTHKRGALCGCLSDQVTHDQNRIDDQKSDDDAIQQSVDVRRKFQVSGMIGNFHHDYHNQQHDLQSQKGRVVSQGTFIKGTLKFSMYDLLHLDIYKETFLPVSSIFLF